MPNVVPLASSFALGMKRDQGRESVPQGGLWNSTDFIPDLDAPLTKRGGWSYASDDVAGVVATSSYLVAGADVPYASGYKRVAVDEDGRLVRAAVDGTGDVTDIGAAVTPIAPLAFHREKLIITASDGTTAPKYYDGSTLGNLGGSPPAGKFGLVYKDFPILGVTAAQPNRWYFGGPGDPTSWSTSDSYIDGSFPGTGGAALRDAILIFSLQRLERIRGNVPPPASDMTVQTLWEPGCVDARSIVFFDDSVVFANQRGIYLTDGASVVDVTERCGFITYWRSLMSSWASTWTLAAGRQREWYVLSVMDGSTFKDGFLIDPLRGRMFRQSNLKALMFWNSIGIAPELLWANRAAARINSGESMWNPAAGVKNDADGTAVTPTLETGWLRAGIGRARFRRIGVAYDMRDAATDNPILTTSYITSPESTSYTQTSDFAAASTTLAETSAFKRAPLNIGRELDGIALKIVQTNASATTKLFGIDGDVTPLSASRFAA